MFRAIIIVSLLISLLTFSANGEAAVFADTHGISARGISMGNAMTAIVNDWSSVYYNIAGLGKTIDSSDSKSRSVIKIGDESTNSPAAGKSGMPDQFAFSVFYTLPQMKLDIDRYAYQDDDPSTGVTRNLKTNAAEEDLNYGFIIIGVALDLNKIYQMPNIISSARLGLGVATGLGSALTMNEIDQRSHNFMLYGREAQRLVFMPGFGLGFMDDMFGFGIGGNMVLRGQSKVKISDTQIDPATQTPHFQSQMDQQSHFSLVAGLYFNPGKIAPVVRGLQIGASYRQENYMAIEPFETTNETALATMEMQLKLSLLDFYTPHTFSLGIAYDFTALGIKPLKTLLVSLELQYQMWSKYKVSSNTEKNPYFEIPDVNDILVPRLGISYDVVEFWSIVMTAMTGYYYQPSFIPDEAAKGKVNWLDNDKHTASLGVKFAIPKKASMGGPVEITLGYQFQYLVERDVTKDPQDAVDYGYNPDYKYGGMVHSIIFETTMKM